MSMEVCKKFSRGLCDRGEDVCRFAHSAPDSDSGTVTICRKALGGMCTKDPCKFWHAPAHLVDVSQAAVQASREAASNPAASAQMFAQPMFAPPAAHYQPQFMPQQMVHPSVASNAAQGMEVCKAFLNGRHAARCTDKSQWVRN